MKANWKQIDNRTWVSKVDPRYTVEIGMLGTDFRRAYHPGCYSRLDKNTRKKYGEPR